MSDERQICGSCNGNGGMVPDTGPGPTCDIWLICQWCSGTGHVETSAPEREALSPALREQQGEVAKLANRLVLASIGFGNRESVPAEDRIAYDELDALEAKVLSQAERIALLAYAEGRQAGAQEERERRDTCSRCGEKHPIHVGCRSNWTGVDMCGR